MGYQPFHVPYTGTIGPDMPGHASDFVIANIGEHKVTNNSDLWLLIDRVQAEAQSLGNSPAFVQPIVDPQFIRDTLLAIDRVRAMAVGMLISQASGFFTRRFGGPSQKAHALAPIMYPGVNRIGAVVVESFLCSLHQAPRVNSNMFDQGLLSEDCATVLHSLISAKGRIMRQLFQKELAGELSPAELTALFEGSTLQPPSQRPTGAAALANETVPAPDAAQLTEALSGVDVVTWVPTDGDWAICATVLKRMTPPPGPAQLPMEPLAVDDGTLVTGTAPATTGGTPASPATGLNPSPV